MGFFQSIKENWSRKKDSDKETILSGLSKARNAFSSQMNEILMRYRNVDEDFFEELENVLLQSDMGVSITMEIIDQLRQEVKRHKITEPGKIKEVLFEIMVRLYFHDHQDNSLEYAENGPSVYWFVGVNGVGKTTTIAKIAYRLQQQKKQLLLAAGDTFRAGAIQQLETWGDRLGIPTIKQLEGSDPAAVIFDAIRSGTTRKTDVILCDSAGRLQNKENLMKELMKIHKVIERECPGAPHEVLLVMDATTGQNGLLQAKAFHESVHVTGIILTKMDGTAKGGILFAIRKELNIPIKFIGYGEKLEDLHPFSVDDYFAGLFADFFEEDATSTN
jgi:fused signal recognition particle receptor